MPPPEGLRDALFLISGADLVVVQHDVPGDLLVAAPRADRR